ncbi:hypothetical protein EAY27_17960 [Vibrio anguillarum]|nr:hypothetical protein [Vibrio anguillarum]NNN69655.1 hypothetical protein [Vibrio sp. 3-2(1)]MBF4256998.1 hypothetical protein [Vibrio anguillarum]MBF4279028.1 hypothetical protein [Vibrio anguillarum]MBF4299405.1 hypothetical protein [Vibrio anguillarum]
MITITWYSFSSISLIYLLWRINHVPSKGITLLCRFLLFLILGGQFWAIFQIGTKTAGVSSKIPFFEDFFIKHLDLPNLEIQWLSFLFFIITVIFCLPKNTGN